MEEGRMRLPRCVSFQSKLIAVETITLERPPDHSITTLYRHRPRPSVITVWQSDGKRPGPASPIKLYRVVCVYIYIFSRDPPFLSLSLISFLICIILDLIRCRLKSLAREAHDRDRRLRDDLSAVSWHK